MKSSASRMRRRALPHFFKALESSTLNNYRRRNEARGVLKVYPATNSELTNLILLYKEWGSEWADLGVGVIVRENDSDIDNVEGSVAVDVAPLSSGVAWAACRGS